MSLASTRAARAGSRRRSIMRRNGSRWAVSRRSTALASPCLAWSSSSCVWSLLVHMRASPEDNGGKPSSCSCTRPAGVVSRAPGKVVAIAATSWHSMSMNAAKLTFAEKLMHLLWRSPAEDVGELARRRVVVHVVPYLFFLYILAYLDRMNVAVARFGMREPVEKGGVGFNDEVLGFGIGIFFWGYWVLEIPSTVSVLKWGARWVFVRILVLWGLACVLLGSIGTPLAESLFGWLPAVLGWMPRFKTSSPTELQFYFFRFLLGFFEGGFFPSVLVYLSLWFRPQDRARAIATFVAAIPLSGALGTPVSGAILQIEWFDMPGWRWIFILQGVVPILAGFATIFFLPARPEQAEWLPAEEKAWLIDALAQEVEARKQHGHAAWLNQAGVVLLLTCYYFCLNVTSYGLSNFMPAIIKAQTGLPEWLCTLVAGAAYLL